MKRLLISILSMLLCLMVATGTIQAESSQQSLQTIANTNETGFDSDIYFCKVGVNFPLTAIYKNTSKKPTMSDVTWSVRGTRAHSTLEDAAGANATKTILGKDSTHEEGTYWLSASLKFNKTGKYLVTVTVYDQNYETVVVVNDEDIGLNLESKQISVTNAYVDYAIRANVVNYGDWYDNFSIELNPGTGSSITGGAKKHQITEFKNSYKNNFTWKVRINRRSYSSGGIYRYKITYQASNEFEDTSINKTIEGSIDLPSTNAKDNTLTATDIFKFKNFGDKTHYLTEEMKNELLAGLSSSEKSNVEEGIATGDNGHCYGMSVAVILNKMGIDPLPNIHSLDNNGTTKSSICYYQITQNFKIPNSVYERTISMSTKERLSLLERETKEVATGGSPVLLCIGGASAGKGHALVAYKVEEGNFASSVTGDHFNRKVYLYDSNRADITSTFLLFNENTDQWEIPHYVSSIRDSDAILKVVTNNLDEIDVKNKNTSKYNYQAKLVINNNTAIELKDQDGKIWNIDPKKKETSGLDYYYQSKENSSQLNVVLPSESSTYTINNASSNKDKLDFGILYDNKYIAISASSANNIKIDLAGSINIGESSKDLKVTITNNNAEENQFDTYCVEGNGNPNLKISPTDEGIKLNGDDLSDVKVTGKNKDHSDSKTINYGIKAYFSTSSNKLDVHIVYLMDRQKCGDNAYYECYSNGTVIIFGTGEAELTRHASTYNWDSFSDSVNKVIVKEGITSIGESMFAERGPNGVGKLGNSPITIKLADSVTSIGKFAFYRCKRLKNLYIGSGLKTIDQYAFSYCSSLSNIQVSSDNKNFSTDDNALYNQDQTILYRTLQNGMTNYKIPNTVYKIERDALGNMNSLKTIYIPASVKVISSEAFDGTNNIETASYGGSKDDWEEVCVDSGNDAVKNINCLGIETASNETGHTWDTEYTIDKSPDYTESGSKSIHCKVCDKKKDVTEIPPLGDNHSSHSSDSSSTDQSKSVIDSSNESTSNNKSADHESKNPTKESSSTAVQSSSSQKNTTESTPTASQQSIQSITNSMAQTKSDQDLKDSVFNKLQLKAPKTTKNSVTVKWNKVSNASQYLVYGAKKGTKYKYLTSTSSNSYTNKKLKKGTYYKYIIIAVDKNGKKMSTSKVVIVTTTNGKTNNPTSIKLNKYKVSLKKGKTFAIRAKLKGKKLKTYRKIAYESSNTKIATVSKKGKITAKKKGKATIYVYAQNGVSKSIKVTVK